MRALAIVHQRDVGPGVFADVLSGRGWELDHWLIAEGRNPPRDPLDYRAVITLGGAVHADQEAAHPWLAREKILLGQLLVRPVPLLGVCLGAQLLGELQDRRRARPASRRLAGWRSRSPRKGPEIP